MKSHIPMKDRLNAIKAFQDEFPNAHVGGSIGLFLHGVDLKRDLSQSDIDLTIDELPDFVNIKDCEESSDGNDFDRCFRWGITEMLYVKIDCRICPEPSFEHVYYDGVLYNVSKLRDILFWKDRYAKKGVQKHIDDLIVINGGERPEPKTLQVAAFVESDHWAGDLPF